MESGDLNQKRLGRPGSSRRCAPCTTGLASASVKVRWNSCYAVGAIFQRPGGPDFAARVGHMEALLDRLLDLLLHDENLKVRSHAAVALQGLHSWRGLGAFLPRVLPSLLAAVEPDSFPHSFSQHFSGSVPGPQALASPPSRGAPASSANLGPASAADPRLPSGTGRAGPGADSPLPCGVCGPAGDSRLPCAAHGAGSKADCCLPSGRHPSASGAMRCPRCRCFPATGWAYVLGIALPGCQDPEVSGLQEPVPPGCQDAEVSGPQEPVPPGCQDAEVSGPQEPVPPGCQMKMQGPQEPVPQGHKKRSPVLLGSGDDGRSAAEVLIRGQPHMPGHTKKALSSQSYAAKLDMHSRSSCYSEEGDSASVGCPRIDIVANCISAEMVPEAVGQGEGPDGPGFDSRQSGTPCQASSFLKRRDSSAVDDGPTTARECVQDPLNPIGSARILPLGKGSAEGSCTAGTAEGSCTDSTKLVEERYTSSSQMQEPRAPDVLHRDDPSMVREGEKWCAWRVANLCRADGTWGDRLRKWETADWRPPPGGENSPAPPQLRYIGQIKEQLWETASLYLHALSQADAIRLGDSLTSHSSTVLSLYVWHCSMCVPAP
eukprot:jgi/Botrbrau1/8694/Bobra.0311s0009.1